MSFTVAEDPNAIGNGDLAVRTDKGSLVALIYAQPDAHLTKDMASVVANALNAAFSPGMTDLMLSPKDINAFINDEPAA